jgi:hypothetical protein
MFPDRNRHAKKAAGVWDEFEAGPARAPRRSLRWNLGWVEVAVLAVMAALCVVLVMPSGDRDHAHRYPPAGPNPGSSFVDVAGEYYLGDGLGLNWKLRILPDGRYSFVWSGCCGVYHRESGALRRISGYVLLAPVEPIEPTMKRVLLPVRWGRRSYLIPPETVEDFCDAILRGGEPRKGYHGDFYLRGLDERADGVPELPEPWAAYLRENLLAGEVVEVLEGGRARVDLGSADGLRAGSFLAIPGRGHAPGCHVVVVAADETSCVVEKVYPDEPAEPVAAGWRVVTSRETHSPPRR